MSGAAPRHSRRTHVVLQLAAALIVLASVLADGSAAAAPKLPGSVWGVAVSRSPARDVAWKVSATLPKKGFNTVVVDRRVLSAPGYVAFRRQGSKAPPHTRGRAAVGHGVHELPPARGLRDRRREAVPHGGNRARPHRQSGAHSPASWAPQGPDDRDRRASRRRRVQRLRLAPRDRCRPEGASPRSRRRAHRRTCGVGARRLHAPARRAPGGLHARAAGARHPTRRRRSVRHARPRSRDHSRKPHRRRRRSP